MKIEVYTQDTQKPVGYLLKVIEVAGNIEAAVAAIMEDDGGCSSIEDVRNDIIEAGEYHGYGHSYYLQDYA